jgi:hypothetical protein
VKEFAETVAEIITEHMARFRPSGSAKQRRVARRAELRREKFWVPLSLAIWRDDTPSRSLAVDDIAEWLGKQNATVG